MDERGRVVNLADKKIESTKFIVRCNNDIEVSLLTEFLKELRNNGN